MGCTHSLREGSFFAIISRVLRGKGVEMSIHNMPEEERPREKLIYSNPSALSTAELLALIIRTGNRDKSAVQLAEEVITYSAAYDGLGNADVKELIELPGIGISKACSIAASIELGKRVLLSERDERETVRGSADAAAILMNQLKFEKREHLVALLLNVKGDIESKYTVSIGELSATSVHPREVFNPAIRKGAAGIIVAHNHPSGDPTPSEEDLITTKRLIDASEIIGITLVDHIIIGHNSYVSIRASGLISNW